MVTPSQTDPQSQVTVFARHAVRPGQEAAFERWSSGIATACKSYAGYLGTEVIRPVAAAGNEFVTIFRFDNYDHLEAWMQSSERSAWLSRASEFSDAEPQMDYHSLEFWFSPERHEGRAPARHKMALVTFLVIWPLVHFVPRAASGLLGAGRLSTEVASVATIVLLMTYVVMPTVTRLLRAWLFQNPGSSAVR